jgi:ATP:ADP antiporter, AAA family
MHGRRSSSAPEQKAVAIAFACNFVLLASYYILRPVRDTVATVVGVGQLQKLFTLTFVGTVIASLVFTTLVSRLRLSRLLPGVFAFWLLNLLIFAWLFQRNPASPVLGAVYYIWFSVVNLFMISVFWSFMVDIFSAPQAIRHFATISAGGALGAIAGPLVMRGWVETLGLSGLLVLAAGGFAVVIALVCWLMQEKEHLRHDAGLAQQSILSRSLSGSVLDGFASVLRSRYFLNQAAFMLLMTWVSTVAYFCQTDLVSQTYPGVSDRARAIADIDLAVNVCTAVLLLFGMSRFMRRFGVTSGLLLNPILMLLGFLAICVSPSLLMVQFLQFVRRVSQYAISRPTREVCFTVVEQDHRYKAKGVIDTVVYRFGDMSSAWLQTGLSSLGYGMQGAIVLGALTSTAWAGVAFSLGRRYRQRANSTAQSAGCSKLESSHSNPD